MANEDESVSSGENRMSEPVYAEPAASILLRAREARGMTIDDIDRITHISPGWVSVMERGDWNQYPSMVYARGHVKVYAEFLGLDVPAILAQFQNDWSQTVLPEPPENNGKPTSIKPLQSSGDKRLYWLIAAIVAVLLLGGLAVKNKKRHSVPRIPVSTVTPPSSEPTVPPVTAPSASSSPPLSTPAPSQTPVPPVDKVSQPVSTAKASLPKSALAPPPPKVEVLPSNRLTLRMVGLKNVWVVVSVDDGTVRHFRLSPGDERTLVGKNFMTFSTQSGDGLALFLNGKRLGLAGPTSAPVVHRRLNRQTLHRLKVVTRSPSSVNAPLKSSPVTHGRVSGGGFPSTPLNSSKPVSSIPLVPSTSSDAAGTGSSTSNSSLTPAGGSH